MANDNIKLFSQFGIDTRSQEQILHEAEQARVQNALAQTGEMPERFPGDRSLRQAGGAVGSWLRNKFDKPELSPEQKMQAAMSEHAKGKVKDRLQNDPEWAKQVEANPALASIETMREMSKWAFDAGEVELASELAMQASSSYLAMREQQAQIDKYMEETESSKARRTRETQTHARDIQDATQILLPGPNGGYNLENIEEQIVTGRWDPVKESWVTAEGNEVDNFMTLDEAVDLKELALEEMDKSGVDGLHGLTFAQKVRLFNGALSTSERSGMRMQFDAMDTQAAIMNRTADMFEEFIKMGQDPAQFLDGSGRITAFVTDMARTVKSVGQTWAVPIKDDKGNVLSMKDIAEEEGTIIEVPSWVSEGDTTGDAAAEYQSAIIQLAYAVARSNEPGARQLSDTDFRNALKELGAASADPERLRRVIFANFSRKADQINRSIQRVGEIASTVGLDPEWGRSNVYGKKVREESLVGFMNTMDRYETLTQDLEEMAVQTELDEAGVQRVNPPESDAVNYFLAE